MSGGQQLLVRIVIGDYNIPPLYLLGNLSVNEMRQTMSMTEKSLRCVNWTKTHMYTDISIYFVMVMIFIFIYCLIGWH